MHIQNPGKSQANFAKSKHSGFPPGDPRNPIEWPEGADEEYCSQDEFSMGLYLDQARTDDIGFDGQICLESLCTPIGDAKSAHDQFHFFAKISDPGARKKWALARSAEVTWFAHAAYIRLRRTAKEFPGSVPTPLGQAARRLSDEAAALHVAIFNEEPAAGDHADALPGLFEELDRLLAIATAKAARSNDA